jgi:hypothetical protein
MREEKCNLIKRRTMLITVIISMQGQMGELFYDGS